MDDLIGALHEQCPLYLSREEFAKTLEGWTFDPIYDEDGSMAVVFLVNGPSFHFAKFDTKFQASKAVLRKYPGSLIQQHGYALTSTPKEDTRQRRFNQRLGFYEVGQDDYDVHLRIDTLRMKESACQ